MNTKTRKFVAFLAAFALLFTSLPAMTGSLDAHAVSAPAKVTGVRVSGRSLSTITISWNKIKKNKNTKGYTVYRNGRAIRSVGRGTSSFRDSGLKGGTTYSYCVRAYNTYKQKQWYNKKTKQWQKKKPSRKYRGKTRKVTLCKYGKASSTIHAATTAPAPLPAPTGLTARSPSAGKLIVTWDAVSGANFKLYVTERAAYSTTGTSFSTEGLPAGTYICRLEYTKDGRTSPKASVTVTVQGSGTGTEPSNPGTTDPGSGTTTPSQPAGRTAYNCTDYLGTQYNFWKDAAGTVYTEQTGGSVVTDLAMYDKNVDGTWTNENNHILYQQCGTTLRYVGNSKNNVVVSVYNGSANKVKLQMQETTKTYKHGNRRSATGPITYTDINCVLNGNDRISTFEYATETVYGTERSVINFGVSGDDAAEGYGFDGYIDGTVHVNVYYDWNGNGTWESTENAGTITTTITKKKKTSKALEIAQAAINDAENNPDAYAEIFSYGLSPYVTDMRIIQKYMLDHYSYSDSNIDGSGLNARCNGGAAVLRVWSAYKYHVYGFVGSAVGGDDHVAFYPGIDGVEKGVVDYETDRFEANGKIQ